MTYSSLVKLTEPIVHGTPHFFHSSGCDNYWQYLL